MNLPYAAPRRPRHPAEPTPETCVAPQIRADSANAADQIYCSLMANAAVHGAMAGYSGFCVGRINNKLACAHFLFSIRFFLLCGSVDLPLTIHSFPGRFVFRAGTSP